MQTTSASFTEVIVPWLECRKLFLANPQKIGTSGNKDCLPHHKQIGSEMKEQVKICFSVHPLLVGDQIEDQGAES
jgi:hypothetical protein